MEERSRLVQAPRRTYDVSNRLPAAPKNKDKLAVQRIDPAALGEFLCKHTQCCSLQCIRYVVASSVFDSSLHLMATIRYLPPRAVHRQQQPPRSPPHSPIVAPYGHHEVLATPCGAPAAAAPAVAAPLTARCTL